MWTALWVNAKLATMAGEAPFGLIENGAIAAENGRIAWVGPMAALPGAPADLAREVHNANGALLTPGLVDCHTHVVYFGDGVPDFEMLARGATRNEMVAAGGGVQRMVRITRAASDEQIHNASAKRVARLISGGVTTLESKSGAGLDFDTELRTMRITRGLGREFPITIVSTFLGAHGLAPEYKGRKDDYVDFLCREVLPAAVREGVVDAVDGFCDPSGFSREQITRLFEAATSHGLPVKLHAEQYTDIDAAGLVAKFRGLSADHLEYVSEPTVRAMAEAGTVAGLLPGANYTLGEKKKPPVDLFRKHGVKMALATNCNLVSSPTTSPTMMMNMGCRLFGMTTEEALAAFTRVGAKALGFTDRGTLEQGKLADFALWDVEKPGELAARIADNSCIAVVKEGREIYRAAPIQIAPPTRH